MKRVASSPGATRDTSWPRNRINPDFVKAASLRGQSRRRSDLRFSILLGLVLAPFGYVHAQQNPGQAKLSCNAVTNQQIDVCDIKEHHSSRSYLCRPAPKNRDFTVELDYNKKPYLAIRVHP